VPAWPPTCLRLSHPWDIFLRGGPTCHGPGYRPAYPLFVRSIVGMDRSAAKDALAGFIAGRTLAANQLEFINLVVDHLTEHGAVDPSRLYESPFTDLTPQGPDALFSATELDELIRTLEEVRVRALAA
jgi:type I restriction enzyme, R subunit